MDGVQVIDLLPIIHNSASRINNSANLQRQICNLVQISQSKKLFQTKNQNDQQKFSNLNEYNNVCRSQCFLQIHSTKYKTSVAPTNETVWKKKP